jgi:hypothetical protein
MATAITGKADINLRSLQGATDKLIVTVHVTRELRLRFAVAKWLILLAGRVLGCGIDVVEKE